MPADHLLWGVKYIGFCHDPSWRVEGNGGIDTEQAWAKVGRRQFYVRGAEGTHLVKQQVTLQPNSRYRLTGWLKSGDTVGGNAGEGFLGVRTTGKKARVVAQETFGDLGGWTKFVVEFDNFGKTDAEVFAGSTMTADRWLQGDNFSLERLGKARGRG